MGYFDIQGHQLPPLRVAIHNGRVQSVSWLRTSSGQAVEHCLEPGDRKLAQKLERDLKQYFSGELQNFDWPLDWSAGTPFQRDVWRALRRVPYGETRSYQWLAARIHRPRSARAVGHANSVNPFSLVVPCHRIIRADGSIGGYAGGVSIKKRLLTLECGSMGERVNG